LKDLSQENGCDDRRDRPHLYWSITITRKEMPMNPNRIPKHCYNGSNTKNCKVQQTADKLHEDETLKMLEKKIDAGAAHIGLVIADIFTFLTKSAAMLPDMELHTELIDLTADDNGISVYIRRSDSTDNENYDDEEEELLYDGD